ncbi:MAG: helix-turn-helix domain-containing protein [Candidatus Thermoplasmatota archaeon]|nr:helix-turn-helix domain-containing protein [Candidatus Thermoplasmatota archaeon]
MDENCTVYKTMDFISKKWTLLILLELYKGGKKRKRYTEIKNKLQDVTPKVLSERLKELESEGLIIRNIDTSQFPVKVEYGLTESGLDFIPVISMMKSWALKWKPHNRLCESVDCRNCEL